MTTTRVIRTFSVRPGRVVLVNGGAYRADFNDGAGWSPPVCIQLIAATLAFRHDGDEDSFVTESLLALIPGLGREQIECLPLEVGKRLLTELGLVSQW